MSPPSYNQIAPDCKLCSEVGYINNAIETQYHN